MAKKETGLPGGIFPAICSAVMAVAPAGIWPESKTYFLSAITSMDASAERFSLHERRVGRVTTSFSLSEAVSLMKERYNWRDGLSFAIREPTLVN